MSKTVIRFQEDNAGNVQFYLEWPPGIAEGKRLFTLKSRAGDAEFQFGELAPEIAKAGMKLRDDLLGHAGIKVKLEAWLGMDDKAYQPLHLELESAAADRLPWEALVDGKGSFLALDKNSPVARVLSAEREEKPKREVLFSPPLRIACVLGAWWEDGGAKEQEQEWDKLKAALTVPDAAALRIDLHVYGCDPNLKARVEATALPGVSVQWEPIVGNAPTLLNRIRAFRPHMLHLYAHGMADDQPYLAVSTVADAEGGEDASIQIGAREIRQEADPEQNIWVIALNSCETAAITRDARSLASQLVRFGFPAVIGMREPVKTADARVVTQHFYEAAFEALNSVPIGGRCDVEWAQFLQRVRLHLAGSTIKAQQSKSWLIPILYARTDPFAIIRGQRDLPPAERTRLQTELDILKKKREEAMQLPLSEEIKLSMKAEFDARIQGIEAQLV
jgi:CHAT domain